jgi:GNAT superfamily N-acetyltransferase
MSVRLAPVPADRLAAWIRRSTEEYAADLVVLGKDPRRALNEAACGMDESFPGGVPLPHHHVLDVYDGSDEIVGYVWIGPSEGGGAGEWWLWDILIEKSHRGQGLGKEAMLAAL